MLREILFKAKMDNGEWIEGDLLHYKNGEYRIANNNGAVVVDPETVCQFTGLYDRNGHRIWENDLLISSDAYYCDGVVEYCNGYHVVNCATKKQAI